MAEAILSVVFAGPLVTLQDAGRPGNMRFGVAASGPMDRLAFDAGNAALGNPSGQTGIELSLGGAILQCKQGAVTLAVTGGDFAIEHNGNKLRGWQVFTLRSGDRLSIRAGKLGSWAYITLAGVIQAQNWLNSVATHTTSGFGGGALHTGQTLTIADAIVRDDREGEIPEPSFLPEGEISVVQGPQDRFFSPQTLNEFFSASYTATDAHDRMGMRLSGPRLGLTGALSIPSEPIIRGSVQVSGDGVPTILLSDHQTTGGYPKIATVISCELDRLVQLRSGANLRFREIDPEEAIARTRSYASQKAKYIKKIAIPLGTLEQRLMSENLIHGCFDY